MNRFFALLLISIITIITGCKKNELVVYHDDAGVYFLNDKSTLTYSFSTDTLTTDTLSALIGIMGITATGKRSFVLEVDKDSTTAVAGRDYSWPPDSSFYIPSDSSILYLNIRIFRTQYLREKSVKLVLRLKSNENFQTNVLTKDVDNKDVAPTAPFIIIIDDILKEPDWWKNYTGFLGVFSRKKAELFVQFLDGELSFNEFIKNGNYYPGLLSDQSALFQQYLDQQKVSGHVIYEEDGTEMIMGPAAQ